MCHTREGQEERGRSNPQTQATGRHDHWPKAAQQFHLGCTAGLCAGSENGILTPEKKIVTSKISETTGLSPHQGTLPCPSPTPATSAQCPAAMPGPLASVSREVKKALWPLIQGMLGRGGSAHRLPPGQLPLSPLPWVPWPDFCPRHAPLEVPSPPAAPAPPQKSQLA
jgi:hypothetical protein